ncbi:hypothetical protein AAG747_27850 [Rapidithrix thailandica]|uniref:Uncharacterized protein n=1 Tax=Rapidithrix thailandica TaxID=413964 RepID=A0AAW9SFD2_9BACT
MNPSIFVILFLCFSITTPFKEQADLPETTSVTPQTLDERKELEKVVKAIFQHLKNKELDILNQRYIHKELGFYDVYRIGVADLFQIRKEIEYVEGASPLSLYHTLVGGMEGYDSVPGIAYAYVEFDCGSFLWNQEGLFISGRLNYPSITQIMTHAEKYEDVRYTPEAYAQAKQMEENSYRVVFTQADIIFYLSKISGRWYIRLVDRVTTDCSA